MKKMILLLGLLVPWVSLANDMPSSSLYQLLSQWQLETGKQVDLNYFSKTPTVYAFIYTHCISMCPITVVNLQKLEKQLSKQSIKKWQFVLVTFSPEVDTPAIRTAFLKEHKLSTNHWHFISGSKEDTQELAMLLNVKYRQESDEIVHSKTLNIVDTQGTVIVQDETGNDTLKAFAAIKQLQ